MMRRLKALALASVAVKVAVLGALWWQSAARAAGDRVDSPAAAPAAAPEPLAQGRGMREMLAAIARRGAELDQREKALADREAAVAALEKTIASAAPPVVSGAAAPPAAGGPAEAEAPVVALTKVYETMKPEEAGPILDRLDDSTARAILAHMKERSIGAILAAMSRDRAVEVTKVLGGVPVGTAAQAPADTAAAPSPPVPATPATPAPAKPPVAGPAKPAAKPPAR
ncbi:MAG TPA: hypothetical protein VKW76_10940 [Candidatus Binatia bacterium]|nr:hypothetical protein [Candidatus Binatia bacterium]